MGSHSGGGGGGGGVGGVLVGVIGGRITVDEWLSKLLIPLICNLRVKKTDLGEIVIMRI